MKNALCLGLALGVVALAVACGHQRTKPPTQASRENFIARGQYVFTSDELVGENGKSCAACHENHVPFEDYSLSRKYDQLPKLIENCLLKQDRVNHKPDQYTPIEVQSLQEYVVYNYVLKGVIADEAPEGIKKLGEAMEFFLRGQYDDALGEVKGARGLVKTERNKVQSYALEGCIQLFQLNEDAAKSAFASAIELDPAVRIDGYVFSPKVLAVLEETRRTVADSKR